MRKHLRPGAPALLAALILSTVPACKSSSPGADAFVRDLAPPGPDLAVPDLSIPRTYDLAVPPDLAAPPDLAVPDLSAPPDLTPAPDLRPPADLRSCVTTLDGVGTGDFTIEFTVASSAAIASAMAVIGQRATCDHSVMWDVRIVSTNQLFIEFDNSDAPYTAFLTTRTVNDGAPHAVVIARRGGAVSVTIDGFVDTTAVSAAQSFPAGSLAALSLGSDVCQGQDGTVALSGSVNNVCLSR